MKKNLLVLVLSVITLSTTYSQVFDSISQITPDHIIRDIVVKGDLIFAATGEGGVWYSADEGFSWTACATLPDAGFGQEAAYSILPASNGDLIVGGNLQYNGSPSSGVVFRSSDNGNSWSFEPYEGLLGYEPSGKIVELPGGDLMMQSGQSKLFTSSISTTAWTQVAAPGGVIFGFECIDEMIFVATNPSAGTAGVWVTTDLGESWNKYGGNGTAISGGTVTIAPIIRSGAHKFIGIGGTYGSHGVFRSGVNDTLWVEINEGLNSSGVYPICMATDHTTIWMVFQDSGGGCKFTSTTDQGNNWNTPVAGLPQQSVGGPCVRKMMVFNTHLYTYANNNIFRLEDVAVMTDVDEAEIDEDAIVVFPNPATSHLTVDMNKPLKNGQWEIANLFGQRMLSGAINSSSSNSFQIEIGDFAPGYYFLKTQVEGQVSVKKFLKK